MWRTGGRVLVAFVAGALSLCAACSDSGSGSGDDSADRGPTTTTTAAATTAAPSTTSTSTTVPASSTGTGPVDSGHPCGALAVDEVAAVLPEATGARLDGTSCSYVSAAGDELVAVDIPAVDDPLDAATELALIMNQFEPSSDPSGQGCDPIDVGSTGAVVDQAFSCTRSSGDHPAALVVRSGPLVIEIIGFTATDLTPLARSLVAHLP